jgi:hypothetical protein
MARDCTRGASADLRARIAGAARPIRTRRGAIPRRSRTSATAGLPGVKWGTAVAGHAVERLGDRIDRGFVQRFRVGRAAQRA